MKTIQTIRTHDCGDGYKLRVVKHTQVIVELFDPETKEWERASEETERIQIRDEDWS